MVHIRKRLAGSSSHGHVWPTDGAVIDVPDRDALELCGIPDGGFAMVEPGALAAEPEATDIDEAPKPRRGRPPKTRPDDDAREIEAG